MIRPLCLLPFAAFGATLACLGTAAAQDATGEPVDLDRDGIPDVLETDDSLTPAQQRGTQPGVRRGIERGEQHFEPTTPGEDTVGVIERDLDRRDLREERVRSLRADLPMLRSPALPRIVHARSAQNELSLTVGFASFDVDPDARHAVPFSVSLETSTHDAHAYFGVRWDAAGAESAPDTMDASSPNGSWRFAAGGVQAWARYVARLSHFVALGGGAGVGAPVTSTSDGFAQSAYDFAGFSHLPDRALFERDLILTRGFFDVAYRRGLVMAQGRLGVDVWIPLGDRSGAELGLLGIGALGLMPSDTVQAGLELLVNAVPTVSGSDSVSRTDMRAAIFTELGTERGRFGLAAFVGLDRWGPSALSLGAVASLHVLF